MKQNLRKVIHVHFILTKKNFYFGSIAAIYKYFSPEELGCTKETLAHRLTHDDSHYITGKVLFIRKRLLT